MSEPDDGSKNFLRRWSRRKQAAALPPRRQDGEAEAADAAKPEIESLPASTTANRIRSGDFRSSDPAADRIDHSDK